MRYIQNARKRALKDMERAVQCQEEHEAILEAIKSRDANRAAQLAGRHIQKAAENIVTHNINEDA